MSAKRRRGATAAASVPAFWDTSAIVPLCCYQSQSARARQTARVYARQVVWWATPVEAISAIHRLAREGHLTSKESRQALDRLDYLRARWNEIQPTEEVRAIAERLLGLHTLRAADALQLGAALVWCGGRARGRHFICVDGRLAEAAAAEGFTVLQ